MLFYKGLFLFLQACASSVISESMKSESGYIEAVTFPCARCGKPVPAEKAKKGRDYVFCQASCERDFHKWARSIPLHVFVVHALLDRYHDAVCHMCAGVIHSRSKVPLSIRHYIFKDTDKDRSEVPALAPPNWAQFFTTMYGDRKPVADKSRIDHGGNIGERAAAKVA